MRNLTIELKKCKRTGILEVLPIIGLLGALYAFANFTVRKDVLLNLPLPPMDVLLTQLYGMIMVLNMFGIIVSLFPFIPCAVIISVFAICVSIKYFGRKEMS